MSSARGMLGRFQRRAAKTTDPTPAAAPDAGEKKDVEGIVDALQSLSPKKQVSVYELWQAPEIEFVEGVTVTVRSAKERRRFVRAVDEEVLEWFRSFCPGEVFYDIGANCGSLTLAAAGMHRNEIEIVAIEPGFANFESLARNLSRNGMLSFVTPLQVALLDRTGLEPINYYGSTSAGTSLHAVGQPVDHENNEFAPFETQMILSYALDDLIDVMGLPEPTRMKVDVDGAEQRLLQGAAKTFARGSVRDVLLEIVDHDRAGTRLSSIRTYLDRQGYELVDSFAHEVADGESFVADHLFRRKDALGNA